MKKLLLFLVTFFNMIAFAGNEVGNGGGVLVEKKTNEAKIFFDSYETVNRYKYDIKWPLSDSLSDVEIAHFFVNRLPAEQFELKQKLSGWINSFYDESVFTNDNLDTLFDMGTGIHISKDFFFSQLIIQFNDAQKIEYLVQKKYWSELPARQRGVAILHEVIYRRAIEVNPRLFSSVKVRMLVAFLISDEVSHFSDDDFKGVLKTLELI